MRAAVIYKPGDIRIVNIDTPKPLPGEIMVKVKACGVCGTDHSLYVGEFPANFPVIIGHEFSGEIVEIGEDVKTLKVGDRVTADPNNVCHTCNYCRKGKVHLCDNLASMGVHIDGANSEFAILPETNAYIFSNYLSYEEAAFTEPLACAINGTNLSGVKLGDTVLVLGAGGMGNLILQCAAHSGAANIIVSEPIEFRRKLALENGATHVIDPNIENVEEELKKINQNGADVVFECTGNLKLQADAIRYVCKGGTIVWFGCSPQGKVIEIDTYYVNNREINITGSFNNPFATSRAIQMLESKDVRVDNLISHRIKLGEYLKVFDLFGRENTMKLIVVMD